MKFNQTVNPTHVATYVSRGLSDADIERIARRVIELMPKPVAPYYPNPYIPWYAPYQLPEVWCSS